MNDNDKHRDECTCYDCVETQRGRKGGDSCCQDGGDGFDITAIWNESFQQAYREVQVDIFKAKIKATMGKTMEKAAGLVLESMLEELRDKRKKALVTKSSKENLQKLLKDALGL